MITYKRDGACGFLRRMVQRRGSVFGTSFCIALPCSVLTLVLNLLSEWGYIPFLGHKQSILKDNGAWGGFSFLVGFLIVFRTSQAYNRFWDGCTAMQHMRGMWYDACSGVVAFCKHSKVDPNDVSVFQHTVVRLFSMLHALALAEIEDSNSDNLDDINAFKYELIDVESIDEQSLHCIKTSDSKVELVYQWLQQTVVENIDTGILSIPPPLLSRVFQEMNQGLLQFHEAIKISTIPFPFPYAQTCDCILIMHYLCTPFVMSQWVSHPVWALIFSFTQVSILWSLNCIAVQIENPFGQDANDLDAKSMQNEMNRHLSVLLETASHRTPRMHASTIVKLSGPDSDLLPLIHRRSSFSEAWETIESQKTEVVRSARSSIRNSGQSNASVRSLQPPPLGIIRRRHRFGSDEMPAELQPKMAVQGTGSSDNLPELPVVDQVTTRPPTSGSTSAPREILYLTPLEPLRRPGPVSQWPAVPCELKSGDKEDGSSVLAPVPPRITPVLSPGLWFRESNNRL